MNGIWSTADAAVQQGFGGEREVFDVVPFAQSLAFGREAGDSDEVRRFRKREAGAGKPLFAFCSPMIDPPAAPVNYLKGEGKEMVPGQPPSEIMLDRDSSLP